jgi:hypothetical protein
MDSLPPITPAQALDRKMDHLAEMVGNLQEAVENRTPTDEALRIAVRDGIVAAASDPVVWSVAIGTLRKQAQAEAGGWLFGGLGAFFSRLAWVFIIGLGIYLIGGWSALVGFVKHGTVP